MLIQPRTLVQEPITAIQNKGVIRVDTARFKTLGVDKNKHVIEISGSTRNRGLYKINEVQSETVIIPAHPLAPDFPAELTPENQPAFTPINQFIFTPDGRNGWQANGLNANNPGLQPFDMVEIRNSASNNGIYQLQPLNAQAIFQDNVAVYKTLAQEGPNGAEARGLLFIRVREEIFCDAADSGSVVVSDGGEVVGLLAGKVDDIHRPDLRGYGFATPITAITHNLGINILTAQNAGEELIVAASEGEESPAGPVAVGRETGRAAVIPLQRHQLQTLRRAQQDLLDTAGGKEYAGLFRRHLDEVQNLINTNKRVAVVWQRNGGPLLAQLAFNAVQNPDTPIPADINGVPLALCLNNILDILEKYGSAELQSDIAQSGASWTRFAGMSFNQVKNGLENSPDRLSA
jgi:hypothetical protein